MSHLDRIDKRIAQWREDLKLHVATMTAGKVLVVKFAKPDSNICSMHFLLYGRVLAVCGDLGDAIYEWGEVLTLEFLAGCHWHYMLGKCCASESGRDFQEYCEETAREQILERAAEATDPEAAVASLKYASFWCRDDLIAWLDGPGSEWLGSDRYEFATVGEVPSGRMLAHNVGLKMAFEQLAAKAREAVS